MATNLVYRNSTSQNRVEVLGDTYGPGVAVLSTAGLPAVTVTGSGDFEITDTISGMTIEYPAGGVGLKGKEVTLAFDGTWDFEVTGATNATAQGTAVYITSGGEVTLTSASNEAYGYVDFPPGYNKNRGVTPVRIGA